VYTKHKTHITKHIAQKLAEKLRNVNVVQTRSELAGAEWELARRES